MNTVAEKLSVWFGSTPFILVHIVWFALWFPLGGSTDVLTVAVSLEAIFLALFILRAENVQADRQEDLLKRIKKLAIRIEEIAKDDRSATRRIERKIRG